MIIPLNERNKKYNLPSGVSSKNYTPFSAIYCFLKNERETVRWGGVGGRVKAEILSPSSLLW